MRGQCCGVPFPVELELCLELLLAVERLLDGRPGLAVRLIAVEELAGAALLHDLGDNSQKEILEK